MTGKVCCVQAAAAAIHCTAGLRRTRCPDPWVTPRLWIWRSTTVSQWSSLALPCKCRGNFRHIFASESYMAEPDAPPPVSPWLFASAIPSQGQQVCLAARTMGDLISLVTQAYHLPAESTIQPAHHMTKEKTRRGLSSTCTCICNVLPRLSFPQARLVRIACRYTQRCCCALHHSDPMQLASAVGNCPSQCGIIGSAHSMYPSLQQSEYGG